MYWASDNAMALRVEGPEFGYEQSLFFFFSSFFFLVFFLSYCRFVFSLYS